MVFFLPIFEGAIYNIYIHTAGLVYAVEFTIPSPAIKRCAFKYLLAPAVVNVHTKRNESAAQVLAREEVIIKPVPVWREHIGYVHVAVVDHFNAAAGTAPFYGDSSSISAGCVYGDGRCCLARAPKPCGIGVGRRRYIREGHYIAALAYALIRAKVYRWLWLYGYGAIGCSVGAYTVLCRSCDVEDTGCVVGIADNGIVAQHTIAVAKVPYYAGIANGGIIGRESSIGGLAQYRVGDVYGYGAVTVYRYCLVSSIVAGYKITHHFHYFIHAAVGIGMRGAGCACRIAIAKKPQVLWCSGYRKIGEGDGMPLANNEAIGTERRM